MLKLRTIGIRDYVVLEGKQRIGWIRLATERMTCVWLWRCCHPSDRRTPDGLIQGHRHGKGGVQGGLESPEGQHHAGAARGGLQAMNIRDDG